MKRSRLSVSQIGGSMKFLILMSVSLFSLSAISDVVDQGFTNVTSLRATAIEVITPTPNCPTGATCAVTTVLQLTYGLNGCVDEASVNYTMERSTDGKIRVLVSALNLHNPESEVVMCFKQPERIAVLTLGPGKISKDNVEVVELFDKAVLQSR